MKKPITSAAIALVSAAVLLLTMLPGGVAEPVGGAGQGTVAAWGKNANGQLGDGSQTDRPTAIQVPGVTGAISVAAGSEHSIALLSDGTVRTWGGNMYGQLGDGTTTDRLTPVQVSGLNGVAAIDGGYYFCLALMNDGTVRAWGDNWYGQLGDGTITDRLTPVQVPGLDGVAAVSGGFGHSLALMDDGTVRAWGHNHSGELGDGTTIDRHTPVQVPGLTGVVAVAASCEHSVALMGDGTVRTWGLNLNGQLGDGTKIERHSPGPVLGLGGVVAITVGSAHNLVLLGDGTLRAWGLNGNGQLGDGTTTERLLPVNVNGLTSPATVKAGAAHNLALMGDGTVRAWGSNDYGQLGDGTTFDRYAPVQAAGLSGAAVVAGGGRHSLATPSNVPLTTWYLAEGTTAWGFETNISIENPNNSSADVRVTYMTSGGEVTGPTFEMAPMSMYTVFPRETLGASDFSTKVECTNGITIAVDRTMRWNIDTPSEEGHAAIGVNSPATTWYLPEGSSNWGFETFLLIQNPNNAPANCMVTYMMEGKSPLEVPHQVQANGRATFPMVGDIGQEDASIKVVSDVPVIPERAMYRNNRREGHDSIGTTTPAVDYYLAEGTSAWGFTTFVLVQNPNPTSTDVTVTYMTPEGPQAQPTFTMQANSRQTLRVNAALPEKDFSTKVHGTQPIIAERAMYWDAGTGEACHDSIGMPEACTTFYLPDGQTSLGRETFTLVQNPNDTPVEIDVIYLPEVGGQQTTSPDSIPANSRKTYNMAAAGVVGRAGILVNSKTPGKKIMCERAMYWNGRGAGTDTIGGSSN